MNKFKELCESVINENNEFFNIFSAHLENYPAVVFIDTDKDIGISIHANSDHFEVIYNFDNKKTFTDINHAMQYAKDKGAEMYSVYDFDSRTKFALEDFLTKAAKMLYKGTVDTNLKYDSNFDYSNPNSTVSEMTVLEPDSVEETRNQIETGREWFELYRNTARVNEIVASMEYDADKYYIIKLILPNGEELKVTCIHAIGDVFKTLPPNRFITDYESVHIENITFMGMINDIKEAMGIKYNSTI